MKNLTNINFDKHPTFLAAPDIAQKLNTGSYLEHENNASLPTKAREGLRQQVTIAREAFDLNICLMILNKTCKEYVHIYDFGVPKNDHAARDFCINNCSLLYRFINHYHDKSAHLQQTIEKQRLHVHEPIKPSISSTNHSNETIKKFLTETKPQNLYLEGENLKLTKRELECLSYTLQGYGSPEIAQTIGISPKTVQSYIENIKIKFECSKRSEIFQKAIQLKLLSVVNLL